MRMLLAISVSALVLLAAACESTPDQPDPAAPDAVANPHARGKRLYEAKCATCHELYDPADFSQAELRRAMRKYAPQSGLKKADRPDVEAYLLAHASDAR
ncbi:MAG: c-type cytochrome [Planctomycetes bacterium]|nr:c-type cytochrome [Planctomycetota bacterium]